MKTTIELAKEFYQILVDRQNDECYNLNMSIWNNKLLEKWQELKKNVDGGCGECECCGDELSIEELEAGADNCFPCQKGNCEVCASDNE